MKAAPGFKKFIRLVMVFLAVYILWSICIDIWDFDRGIDDEALIPCLFFLPPAGFLVLFIAVLKAVESAAFMRFMKFVISQIRKNRRHENA